MSSLVFGILLTIFGCGGQAPSGTDGTSFGELIGILITPENVVVPLGAEGQLTATGLYDDHTTRNITASVNWKTSNSGVVSVANALDTEGLVVGLATGQSHIGASIGDTLAATVTVTVTDADLIGISVEPDNITLSVTQSAQLTATAAYSDGTRGNVNGQVRWITANGSVATVEDGWVTGASIGDTTVHVQWDSTTSEPITVSVNTGGTPDLTVESLIIEAGDNEGTINLTVANTGEGTVSNYWIDIFVDPAQTPQAGDFGDYFVAGGYLGGQSTFDGAYTIDLTEGEHEIVVLLDTDNAITESNESNNTKSATVTISGQMDIGPNLTVTYFDFIQDDEVVYYYVDIVNNGGEDVGPFYVDLFYDRDEAPVLFDDGEQWIEIDNLTAGTTTYADFLVDVSDISAVCAYCWSWIMIDGYDNVIETNESDNIIGPMTVYP